MTTSNTAVKTAILRAMWAAMNLNMQLIRAGERVTLYDEDLLEAHMRSIEDRINELDAELVNLRSLPSWPDEEPSDDDE